MEKETQLKINLTQVIFEKEELQKEVQSLLKEKNQILLDHENKIKEIEDYYKNILALKQSFIEEVQRRTEKVSEEMSRLSGYIKWSDV